MPQAKADIELCCPALPPSSRWHIQMCESQKPALLCPAWAALRASQKLRTEHCVAQAKADVELCCLALPLNSRWHIQTRESQKPVLLCPVWAALPTSQCAPVLSPLPAPLCFSPTNWFRILYTCKPLLSFCITLQINRTQYLPKSLVGGGERQRANGRSTNKISFTCKEFYEMKISQCEKKSYQKNCLQEIYGIKTKRITSMLWYISRRDNYRLASFGHTRNHWRNHLQLDDLGAGSLFLQRLWEKSHMSSLASV
jgi:hypothetical protein